MPNGRCIFHGGKSGAPPGNKNGEIHGIYAVGWTDAEKKTLPQLVATIDTLQPELLVAKIQLARVQKKLRELEEHDDDDDEASPQALERTEMREERVGSQLRESTTRRRPDYMLIQDRLLGRIGKLLEQQVKIVELKDLQQQLDKLQRQVGSK